MYNVIRLIEVSLYFVELKLLYLALVGEIVHNNLLE